MKSKRQEVILDIITHSPVETQEELLSKLTERGIRCTQSTISRDIKELRLVKELSGGAYRYTVSMRSVDAAATDRLQRILRECCTGCDYAQNLVVIKTMPGLANAVGAALDTKDTADLVGCVCGDDTALFVMRSEAAAASLCEEIDLICK